MTLGITRLNIDIEWHMRSKVAPPPFQLSTRYDTHELKRRLVIIIATFVNQITCPTNWRFLIELVCDTQGPLGHQ